MANENDQKNQKPRPPVVVIMGHVDHGKTTLLDRIRKESHQASRAEKNDGEPRSIAEREAGGITQAVGAYEVTHNLRRVTFIDTPGHEAFAAMRSRGAKIADLAVLVVAADEGVKPQTKEAVNILKETKTPFVVAINKIDKTGGDIERVKNDLMAAEVFLEGFGGQVSYHGISAKKGEGINELLDLIILAADLEGLAYNPLTAASGYVLEATHGRQRGVEATLIVLDGVLRKGDAIFTPSTQGKIKILENFLENACDALEPSAPAVVIGFESIPHVGEQFLVGSKPANREVPQTKAVQAPGENTLNLILKASEAGSLEALSSVVRTLGSEEKSIYIVGESVGDVTDGDVKSAVSTRASIIAFKNKINKAAKNLAEGRGVRIITSDIIYELIKVVEEFLKETQKPKAAGELGILAVFNQKKLSEQLVGGRVASGIIRGKANFEIYRGEEKIGTGKILSIREKKTDIGQAESGKEIGLLVNSQTNLAIGDKIVISK